MNQDKGGECSAYRDVLRLIFMSHLSVQSMRDSYHACLQTVLETPLGYMRYLAYVVKLVVAGFVRSGRLPPMP